MFRRSRAIRPSTARSSWSRSNFYDPSALGRFGDAVRETVAGLPPPAEAKTHAALYDPAIDRILASLGASHTGRYTADQLDYYELADIFRFNYRDRLRELFPPDGEITYPGIGIATEVIDGKRFVSDVYDGAPADKAGVKPGDEILSRRRRSPSPRSSPSPARSARR